MNLSEVTTDQLRAELKSRGFQVANLWCLDDVETGIMRMSDGAEPVLVLSDDDKMIILEQALTGDGVMEAINEAITDLLYEEIEGEAEED